MVSEAFLSPLGLGCVEVSVPLLNDTELDDVVQSVPGLQLIAANPVPANCFGTLGILTRSVRWTGQKNPQLRWWINVSCETFCGAKWSFAQISALAGCISSARDASVTSHFAALALFNHSSYVSLVKRQRLKHYRG